MLNSSGSVSIDSIRAPFIIMTYQPVVEVCLNSFSTLGGTTMTELCLTQRRWVCYTLKQAGRGF